MFRFISLHKKLFAAIGAFIALLWLVTAQVKGGRMSFLERPVLGLSGIIERSVSSVQKAVAYVWNGYVFLVRTERENKRLREEIDRLRLEAQLANEVLIENERLRSALGFQRQTPYSSIVVQVVSKEVSPTSSSFIINKGAVHGIQKNMAVITPDGVVGKVQAVLDSSARVILLTDPDSVIAVRVQRNREEGLLEGKLNRLSLKYVSYYADIQEGDLLVTSGFEGIFPKGLPVAVVTSVEKHEAKPFQTVTAKPVVSFSRVEEALVLKP